jgi:hypothetical protein
MARNYRDEYDKHHSSTKAKKDRAARNKARNDAKKNGKVSSKTDIDHKKPLRSGGTNAKSNLRKRSVSSNRADNGHKKGEKHKKHKK